MHLDYQTFCEVTSSMGATPNDPGPPIDGQTTFGFYLTFRATTKGVFFLDKNTGVWENPEGKKFRFTCLHADSFKDSTRFYFNSGGFSSEEQAHLEGNRLRNQLSLVNISYSLGLILDYSDVGPPEPWYVMSNPDDFKNGVRTGVNGLWVYREDIKHSVFSADGQLDLIPEDAEYIFKALDELCGKDCAIALSERPAVELLTASANSHEPRAIFLLNYAALVTLVPQVDRGKDARDVIKQLKNVVEMSKLSNREKQNFSSFLGMAKRESQKEAFNRIEPDLAWLGEVEGHPTPIDLIFRAYDVRNDLSHPKTANLPEDIVRLSSGLRFIAVALIASRNDLLPLNFPSPGSKIWPNPDLAIESMSV